MSAIGGGKFGLAAQGLVGFAMLIYALRAPKSAEQQSRVEPGATTYAGLALLGVTVTAMELPTAMPYFGAIALLTKAGLSVAQWMPLLVLYSVIFVAPPTLLVAGHVIFGKRLEARYAGLRDRLQSGARETMLWILGLVGGGLFVSSVIEYLARYR